MDKKKTIYIHIGSPKTGTTSIQQFLTINAKILAEEEGLFYPLVGRLYDADDILRHHGDRTYATENVEINDHPIAVCMNGFILTHFDYNETSFSELLQEFSASQSHSMVLSDEIIFDNHQNDICNRENLFEHLAQYDVKIIIYLKRAVEYLSGHWQERLRHEANTITALEAYLETYPYAQALQMIDKLAQQFGNENIIIKSFEKEVWRNNNLIDDFLSIMNIENSARFKPLKTDNNIGMSRQKNEMLRYIKQYLDVRPSEHHKTDKPKHGLFEKLPDGDNQQKIVDSLSDELIKKISDQYYPYECEIAQKFLGREELFTSKYPKIYNVARDAYLNEFTPDIQRKLDFIINITLQQQAMKPSENSQLQASFSQLQTQNKLQTELLQFNNQIGGDQVQLQIAMMNSLAQQTASLEMQVSLQKEIMQFNAIMSENQTALQQQMLQVQSILENISAKLSGT